MIKKILILILTTLLLTSCGTQEDPQQQSLSTLAYQLNFELAEVKYASRYLSVEISNLYDQDNRSQLINEANRDNYAFNDLGMYYQKSFYSGSSSILTGKTAIDEQLINKVLISEGVEDFFEEYYQKYIQIKQLSFVDDQGFARVYPGVDLVTQVEKGYDFSSFDFFEQSVEYSKDFSKVIWLSEPYIDPFGRGWVISNASPVYNDDHFLGVVNTAITIEYICEKYLEKNMIIVSEEGNIIGIDSSLSGLFNLLPPKKYKYTDIIRQDIYVDDDYNVFNNKDFKIRALFNRIFENNQERYILTKDKTYTLYVEEIPEVKWKMIKVIR